LIEEIASFEKEGKLELKCELIEEFEKRFEEEFGTKDSEMKMNREEWND